MRYVRMIDFRGLPSWKSANARLTYQYLCLAAGYPEGIYTGGRRATAKGIGITEMAYRCALRALERDGLIIVGDCAAQTLHTTTLAPTLTTMHTTTLGADSAAVPVSAIKIVQFSELSGCRELPEIPTGNIAHNPPCNPPYNPAHNHKITNNNNNIITLSPSRVRDIVELLFSYIDKRGKTLALSSDTAKLAVQLFVDSLPEGKQWYGRADLTAHFSSWLTRNINSLSRARVAARPAAKPKVDLAAARVMEHEEWQRRHDEQVQQKVTYEEYQRMVRNGMKFAD